MTQDCFPFFRSAFLKAPLPPGCSTVNILFWSGNCGNVVEVCKARSGLALEAPGGLPKSALQSQPVSAPPPSRHRKPCRHDRARSTDNDRRIFEGTYPGIRYPTVLELRGQR